MEPSSLQISAAWISPDGKFYPVDYAEHYQAALQLCEKYNYKVTTSADDILQRLDWIRLYRTGDMWLGWALPYSNNYKVTQAQLDTLFDLSCLPPDEDNVNEVEFVENITAWLDWQKTQNNALQ